jgi:hypothetical protein
MVQFRLEALVLASAAVALCVRIHGVWRAGQCLWSPLNVLDGLKTVSISITDTRYIAACITVHVMVLSLVTADAVGSVYPAVLDT